MDLGGYVDHVARIDLTTGDIKYEGLNEENVRKYIGGRGLGVKYVFDNGPKVDPLSPDNIICFLVGPLTGTDVSMSGRMAVVTKSPLTGTVTDSHHGGWSGARLKWAGFDGLIFKGKAEQPTYAYIEAGKVELKDASDLWGKGAHETIKILQKRHGKDVSVVTLGQAGENLVRYACWMNENDRASGRGGTGAVGGSKNLKALVIKAAKKLPKPKDREAFKQAHKDALKAINENDTLAPRKGGLSVYGTNSLMMAANTIGALPAKNAQFTSFENAFNISGHHIKETILVGDPTCHACPVACKKEVETEPGKFHVRMESVEYESAWAFGAQCDNDNRDSIPFLIDLCNDYGIDTIDMGNVLAMTMEASEKELIRERVGWGDVDKMVELVHKIAKREGIGDILANGIEPAAKAFGDPSIAMSVKGQAIPAYDPRGMKGMGVGYATSNRGACHLRGYTPASEVVGVPEKTDPLAWKGKGKLLKLFQDFQALSDSLGVCKFSTFAENPDHYAAQYAAVVGVPMDANAILTIGERIYNLERHYNNLAGFGEGSDTLPARFLNEPSQSEPSQGHICELDQMLEEYYAERGWVKGVVPEKKLKALQII
ncbi:MAG: aldehyde ferredoxin oxidoreductase family protein [Dehalococcoidia bacterium]|nr:MAG: aldehyde ferredoxin oxidoreductase family protein [Dehalococcoidia bacterium]